MEFLNAQAKFIREQMRSMSLSQRAAIGLLLVILVAATWWMLRWGGQGEWAPLLDQSFTQEQIQQVQAELVATGVKSKVEGDRILVQGGDDARRQLTALLAQRGALPRDTSLGYAALASDDNVFESDQKAQWKQSRGLETELSQVLRKFRGIKDAHVFVEMPKNRGFGAKRTASRASVHVALLEGEVLDKQRVSAIANFVAGAVRGLSPENVKLTDGTRFYRPPDLDEAMPAEYLDLQRQQEQYHTRKVYDQLQYISGVLVNVYAVLRSADEQTQERIYGKEVIDKEVTEAEEMTGPSVAEEPGVRANMGRALAEAGQGSSSTREKSETSFNGLRDQTDKTTIRPKGFVERLTASVNVPRSYLIRVIESQGATDVQDADVVKVAAVELPKIAEIVKPLINATEDDQVVVSWYYDVPPESPPAAALAGESTFVAMAKDYGPQAGLALLALFGLFMMFRVAQRAQAAVAVSSPAAMAAAAAGVRPRGRFRGGPMAPMGAAPMAYGEEVPLEPLGGGPATVGEAQGVDGILVGHEVDESMVRTQQIIKQISQIVQEDPSVPASIIDKWVESAE